LAKSISERLPVLPAGLVGQARSIFQELEIARCALDDAARQIAALYPEILRLERAAEAAITAQEARDA
jgi:hypothetical protein